MRVDTKKPPVLDKGTLGFFAILLIFIAISRLLIVFCYFLLIFLDFQWMFVEFCGFSLILIDFGRLGGSLVESCTNNDCAAKFCTVPLKEKFGLIEVNKEILGILDFLDMLGIV